MTFLSRLACTKGPILVVVATLPASVLLWVWVAVKVMGAL